MSELLEEIHPGEILLEDFMKPMGITARQLAADIDVLLPRLAGGSDFPAHAWLPGGFAKCRLRRISFSAVLRQGSQV